MNLIDANLQKQLPNNTLLMVISSLSVVGRFIVLSAA